MEKTKAFTKAGGGLVKVSRDKPNIHTIQGEA